MNATIEGLAWKCADNITAYNIIPPIYWGISNSEPDGPEMGKHLFEGVLSTDDQPIPYVVGVANIIVAGENFGCGGKSIAQPVIALQHAGVKLVIAKSFSRYFFRNAINLALPVLVCPDIHRLVASANKLSVNLIKGSVRNISSGEEIHQCDPITPFAWEIINAGGVIAYYCHAQNQKI